MLRPSTDLCSGGYIEVVVFVMLHPDCVGDVEVFDIANLHPPHRPRRGSHTSGAPPTMRTRAAPCSETISCRLVVVALTTSACPRRPTRPQEPWT